MSYFLEWCFKPSHRNGTFLPEGVVNSRVGFRSVYGFLEKPTSSKGLANLPTFSDTLFLDFDSGTEIDSPFQRAIINLKLWDVCYLAYLSGHKGGHIHIPIQEMCGLNVPYSQEQFVKRLNFDCDLSLYRAGSLIRLPGTIHEKTGKPKELFDQKLNGFVPEVPLLELPNPPKPALKPTINPQADLINAISRLNFLLNKQPTQGNRSITIWSLASTFARSGISFDTCLELCYELNASWKEPKSQEVVLQKVKEAYGK